MFWTAPVGCLPCGVSLQQQVLGSKVREGALRAALQGKSMQEYLRAAYEDLMQLSIELFSFDPFADRIWELRHNITSYEAWYVAVAEALRLPLATLDERLF